MYLAAKQQISWVVSLWQSPPTFVWPRVPKQRTTTASSSQLERHLTVFCINEIVLGYVVYLVKTNSDRNSKQFQPYCVQKSKIEVFFLPELNWIIAGVAVFFTKVRKWAHSVLHFHNTFLLWKKNQWDKDIGLHFYRFFSFSCLHV